jgi:hypothetical protein
MSALCRSLQVTREDVGRVISGCLNHRLRKDPLDPIDSGTKVAMLFKRLTDPEFVKREEEAKKKQEAAAAEAAKAAKKPGGWCWLVESLLFSLLCFVVGGMCGFEQVRHLRSCLATHTAAAQSETARWSQSQVGRKVLRQACCHLAEAAAGSGWRPFAICM